MKKITIFIVCILACTSIFSQEDIDIFPGDYELSQIVVTTQNSITDEIISKKVYTDPTQVLFDTNICIPQKEMLIWNKVWVAWGGNNDSDVYITELILSFNRHKYIMSSDGVYPCLHTKWVENDIFEGITFSDYTVVNQGNSIMITFDPYKDNTVGVERVWILELVMVKP